MRLSKRTTWAELKAEREKRDTPETRAIYQRTKRAIEIGERIRAIRLERGISQDELARRVGTSQAAIGRLELGSVEPRLSTLQKIGEALGAELIVDLNVLHHTA